MTADETEYATRIATAAELAKYLVAPNRTIPVAAYQFPDVARCAGIEISQYVGHILRIMLAGIDVDIQVVRVKGMLPALTAGCLYNPVVMNDRKRPSEVEHGIVRVGSKYYDYTVRQFNNRAEFPMVIDQDDLPSFWREIEEGDLPDIPNAPISFMDADEISNLMGALMVTFISPVHTNELQGSLNASCGVSLTWPEIRKLVQPVWKQIPKIPEYTWDTLYLPSFKLWSPALNPAPLDPESLKACKAEVEWYNSHIKGEDVQS